MRWRGRRESSNIIDLRNIPFTRIVVGWLTSNEHSNIPAGAYIVDTDGSVYLSYNGGQDGVVMTPFDRIKAISTGTLKVLFMNFLDDNPTLSNAQLKTINQVIELIPANIKSSQIELSPSNFDEADVYLLQVMRTALNNR